MPKPKVPFDLIKETFAREGSVITSEIYVNNETPLTFVCACGAADAMTWMIVRHGSSPRCKGCRSRARSEKVSAKLRTPEKEVRECLQKFGATLINLGVNKNGQLFPTYFCKCGRETRRLWTDIKNAGHPAICGNCSIKLKSGENAYQWNPNLTDAERSKGRPVEVKRWYDKVRLAFNSTCVITGKIGNSRNLSSHHLYSYRTHPELRVSLANGVCLLRPIHLEFHSRAWFGRGKNTYAQFAQFYQNKTGKVFLIPDPLQT